MSSARGERLRQKKSEVTSLKDRIAAIESYLKEARVPENELDSRLSMISQQRAKLIELEADKLVAAETYNQIVRRLEVAKRETRVEDDDFGMEIVVVEEPKVPQGPLPMAHLSLVLMAFVGSFGVSAGLAYLMTFFDTSIRSGEDLRRVAELPILGTIDRMYSPREIKTGRMIQLGMAGLLVIYVLCSNFVVRTFFL